MEDLLGDGRLLKRVEVLGHGERPKKGDRVEVQYETRLIEVGEDVFVKRQNEEIDIKCAKEATVIDSSELFDFVLGSDEVLEAWDLAVATMQIGERSSFIAHHSLTYGEEGAGEIPPCATLHFRIWLSPQAVPAAEAAPAPQGQGFINECW